jgi:hypothetical protein
MPRSAEWTHTYRAYSAGLPGGDCERADRFEGRRFASDFDVGVEAALDEAVGLS